MPTMKTASNSGHATPSIEGTDITITLDCAVEDLETTNHGTGWGNHKWLGFGVRTGLDSVVGITFTDDTGVSVTMTEGDETEASSLGLEAGDFVLYIKADQEDYLTGDKYFTLTAEGMEETTFTMTIVEAEGEG